MTAPAGAVVGLYVDLHEVVQLGDVIETQTGRRYLVASTRVQRSGMHAGRQHLRAVVLAPGAELPEVGMLHRIVWYRRKRRAR